MSNESFPFEIGNFECIAVSDGTFDYPAHSFFVNAPKERLEQVLREQNIKPEVITAPWTCLFVNTGQHRVLVDTGGGAGTVPSAGKLLRNLRAAGIEPIDIDTVILTHGHPDHIGGNTDADSNPAFPNARYVMLKDEWEFWTSEPDLTQLEVEEEIKQIFLMLVRKNLPPIQSQLDLIDSETEILPGIKAIAAPGHTPGHMTLAISSGSEKLLYISDTVLHPIHLEHPDWYPVFDFVREHAMTTKRRLLDQVVTEKVLVIACHFPFPGLGHVIQKGDGWQWQPIEMTG